MKDNHSSKYSQKIGTEPSRKKPTVKQWTKVNVCGCFFLFFQVKILIGSSVFKQHLNAELTCNIYKRGTALKQFGLYSTIGEQQEDNDTWNRALHWK